MGWKNLPYWLKGGILGAVISVIFFIPLVLEGMIVRLRFPKWFEFVFGMLHLPAVYIGLGIIGATSKYEIWFFYLLGFFVDLLIYFLIGAFIGWIIGKIKYERIVGGGE